VLIFLLSILAGALYCGLIVFLLKAWEEIIPEDIPTDFQAAHFVSILVVGRNESENIQACLSSILENTFEKTGYEIIFIDDHSTDDTIEKIEELEITNLQIIHLSDHVQEKINAFKKAAIKIGIEKSKGNLILMTDADCIVPKDWIQRTCFNFQSKEINFQTAPVTFSPIYKFLHWFQELDIIAMMATTNAGIRTGRWFLANGANLAFLKKELPENYFQESDKFASGDDVFLINEFAQANPKKVHFEKQMTVKTKPQTTIDDFFQQRIRWAGKNKILVKGKMSTALLIPVLFYLWCFVLLILSFTGNQIAFWILLCIFLIKILLDHALLQFVHKDLSNHPKMKFFLSSSLIYPFYFLGIGFLSLLKTNYQWKGRKVK